MKFSPWPILGFLIVIFSGLLLVPASSFTPVPWPPVSEPPEEPSLPSWPPNTETDDLTTSSPLNPNTTPNPGDTPGAGGDESNAWMVVAIIFIVLTIVLALAAAYLYVSMPKRPLRPGRTFVLPRVNP